MRTKIDGHFNTELPIKKIRSTRLKNMYCIFMIQVVDRYADNLYLILLRSPLTKLFKFTTKFKSF